jgi:putative PEP-CTERM system histidine kinase
VESPGGSLWLRTADGQYAQHAHLNAPPSKVVEAGDGPLCQFLETREWVIDLEEFRVRRSHYEGLSLPDWLLAMEGAWLILPLKSGDSLIGFVLLNAPRTPFEINWEVRDLLKTAQRQAASYLARMQAAEALLEARKFDSFNRMSAFVVHDLKNLVAQLALMLRNAERHRDNPEFQQDMLETVAHVESRMRALMLQLQDKSPIEPPRPVDLKALVERIHMLKRSASPLLSLQCAVSAEASVMAHAERLERVLGHLVQNALDATAQGGKVDLALHDAGEDFIAFEVADTGCGMSPGFIRERLARPFQSTKEGGMGLGVYETSQYIRELGGTVVYESEEARGTRVIVRLPRWQRATPAVLQVDMPDPATAPVPERLRA